MKSFLKAATAALGVVAMLAMVSVGLNLMNRPSSLNLAGGFVLIVVALWAAVKGARLWIEW